MDFTYIKILGRFVFFVLIQILIFNQILISGYINPFFYITFILLLPFNVKGWFLLLSSFFLGLTIDMFSNSLGIHTAACVFLAFVRPTVINLISRRKEFEKNEEPGTTSMSVSWVFLYVIILTFVHHLVLFSLEIFRFDNQTFLKTFLSSAFSIIFIIMYFLFIAKVKKK